MFTIRTFKEEKKMEKILMVKVGEKTHKELMQLKYNLKEIKRKSASTTIQFLIDFYRKNKRRREK